MTDELDLTDGRLAEMCAASYDAEATWDQTWEFEGTHVTRRKAGDVDVIVFRGTACADDWIRDAEAFPVWDGRLGFVHKGFMVGMDEALAAVLATCSRVIVTGHSLGGARARILAALLAFHSRPVERCVVFGSPRPAFVNLARVLQKSKTPLASYRNRNDPVPLVPFFGGLYQHPDAWKELSGAPDCDDFDPLRDHGMALYLAALNPPPTERSTS